MIVGIILAAGKGTRIGLDSINKTALIFRGKPLICYGVDLLSPFCKIVSVVVGAYSQSVEQAVGKNKQVKFVCQRLRDGTGRALSLAIKDLNKTKINPEIVLVGYGDHMMFYTAKVIKDLLKLHSSSKAAATLVSTIHQDQNGGWGRVVRNSGGGVEKLVEEKDASKDELENNELNAGLYCFDFNFLLSNLKKLTKSTITGEYYLTDFIDLAVKGGLKVVALKVDFKYVGLGINTREQIGKSAKLHRSVFKAR